MKKEAIKLLIPELSQVIQWLKTYIHKLSLKLTPAKHFNWENYNSK